MESTDNPLPETKFEKAAQAVSYRSPVDFRHPREMRLKALVEILASPYALLKSCKRRDVDGCEEEEARPCSDRPPTDGGKGVGAHLEC